MNLLGSASAESDPVKTSQLARLRFPRAHATEPGRGPNLRLVYTRAPCAPPSGEQEKRHAAGRENLANAHKKMHVIRMHIYFVYFWHTPTGYEHMYFGVPGCDRFYFGVPGRLRKYILWGAQVRTLVG